MWKMTGNIAILRGKTQKGKNRIKEHGEVWFVIDHKSPFRDNQLFVESRDTGDRRWVTDDFEVVDLTTDEEVSREGEK